MLGIGVLALFFIWIGSLRVRNRFTRLSTNVFIAIVGAFALAVGFWSLFQFLGKFISLSTSWSLWPLAIMGAVAAEIIVWLYRFERTIVSPVRGRWLLALRVLALTTLIAILLQPVHSFLKNREINREVVILVDESESMNLSDQRLSVSEMMDRADLFKVDAVKFRPPLNAIRTKVDALASDIQDEITAIKTSPDPNSGIESRAEGLNEFLAVGTERAAGLVTSFDEILNQQSEFLGGDSKNKITDFRNRTRDGLSRIFQAAENGMGEGNGEEVLKQLEVAAREIGVVSEQIPFAIERVDQTMFDKMSEGARKTVTDAAAKTRRDIARAALQTPISFTSEEGAIEEQTLLDRLKSDYNVRYYRFARDTEELVDLDAVIAGAVSDTTEQKPERALTDLTGALEHVLENTSPESLAGVLLLSDGQHNAVGLPEDSLRQMAVQNSPFVAVPIGGYQGPVDASLLSLNAPESIYLGDRILVKAEAKLDGLRGKKVRAVLKYGGEVVEEQEIDVPDINFRTELRFVHFPAEKGIFDYQVELEPSKSELFSNNNSWDFKVAVTDDRTNVLLVDNFPRWEFRYLRNLFYGRDKSVHLQYVLLNPDTIDRMNSSSGVPASASRKFGDAEATELPNDADEWAQFDVIILGDLPANSLQPWEWDAIQESVTKRGALLVCVAGPRHMPHSFSNETFKRLLPITYEQSDAERFEAPEKAYRIELTTVGRGHPVTAQSTSRSLNGEIWGQFPTLRWRSPVTTGVKDGAEVLAYARPIGDTGVGDIDVNGSPDSVEAAIQQLANQKTYEKEHALITIQRSGLGKVAMMNFDQTWRFRYGVGDTYHHRFWGQLTRWGAGANLRSGNERVRLGTDRLSYTPNDEINITSKVLDADRKPITEAEVYASIYDGEKRLLRQKLSYRTDSSGIYETTVAGLPEAGEYTVRIEGEAVDSSLAEGEEKLETELLVVTTRNPIELAELTANRDFLNRAAQMTGGHVAEISNLQSLVTRFGSPKETLTERENVTLWDKWPLLVLFLGFLTTEWILRRKSGLA